MVFIWPQARCARAGRLPSQTQPSTTAAPRIWTGEPYALTPSALIAWTLVTSGTMTNRLDRLEQDGLVERRPNPEDGRGWLVALTPQGRTRIDAALAAHVANQHRLLDGLPPALRDELDAGLRAWLELYEADAAEGG